MDISTEAFRKGLSERGKRGRLPPSEKVITCPFGLVSTPCHFGGVRWWFQCSGMSVGNPCGRRVGKLYLPPGERYFACRYCHNLIYKACKEHDSRVDEIVKDPSLLESYLEGGDVKGLLLAIKARRVLMQKLLRQSVRDNVRIDSGGEV
jgi:hypothetical protein